MCEHHSQHPQQHQHQHQHQHSQHPQAQQGPIPHLQQHPRPASLAQHQRHPASPHPPAHSQHPGSYPPPPIASHGLPIQHQAPYPPIAAAPNGPGHPSDVAYYSNHSGGYASAQSGQYPSPDTPDLMAATHMGRPYPPMGGSYHPSPANASTNVPSPQGHDQHRQHVYQQAPSPMSQNMYAYQNNYQPMSQVQQSPYASHPAQQQGHHGMPSQSLLMSHQHSQSQLQHQQPQASPVGMTNSPRMKIEPPNLQPQQQHPHQQQQHHQQQQQPQPTQQPSQQQQRPSDPSALQRPPSVPIMNPHVPPSGPPINGGALHHQSPGSASANSNAAPGPIPATTPLVVRQDGNGVQWIAFEYSRDRVKMEYTIRCDVESVNVDNLSPEFKTENCVYPRACGAKEQYRGNRLVYETECNTVGWALAELNLSLRGKRGLIQRAVDSWRNSNQDPKLRSRRVRRMAKMNNRKAAPLPAGHGGPGQVAAPVTQHQHQQGTAAGNQMAAVAAAASMQRQQPQPGGMLMGGPGLHHHGAHPGAGVAGGQDDGSGMFHHM